MADHESIGKRPPRIDALDKVTGKAIFAADVILPGMIYGKVLRSPHAHARIARLDTARARALEGVMAVVTADDVPGLEGQSELLRPMWPTMAKGKVVFAGQPVAAVAAITPFVAEEALSLIDIEYEPLPSVIDAEEAMRPEAPVIFQSLYTENLPGKEHVPSNAFWYMENVRGDVEQGFQKADIVLENTFRTQTVHQGYIELRASMAALGNDGKILVWTDNQGIFKVRDLVAAFLKVPLNRVKVIPVEVGGAFGGKEHQQLSPLCALLAQKTGLPVRMAMTRSEVLSATRPSPASVITLKAGVTREGRITAFSATMIYDYGAGTGMPGLDRVHFGSITGLSAYRVPNFSIKCYDVVTNKAPSGPYRAPSAAQAAFAVESQLDLLARALEMDPIDFRLKNIAAKGDATMMGTSYGDIGFRETLERMKKYLAEREAPKARNCGRGVAAGLWFTVCLGSAAHVNVNVDGSIALVVGSTDVSGTRTTFAQMVAEEFGIPLSQVTVVTGDTETAPFSMISAGSMTTRSMGKAIYRACQDVKEQACQRAARKLGVDPEDVEYRGRGVRVKEKPDAYVPLTALVEENLMSPYAGPITGRGAGEMLPELTPVLAVHAAEVEVDEETGKVKVLSYAAAQDAGLAINPALVEGQMQGAVVQGIGWALSENCVFREGVMENASLLDYRMPTAADAPFIDAMLVEVSSGLPPYGMRGVGEPPLVPALAAMANAIQSAVGVRLTELPMTPEAVLEKIKGKSEKT